MLNNLIIEDIILELSRNRDIANKEYPRAVNTKHTTYTFSDHLATITTDKELLEFYKRVIINCYRQR